MAVNDQKTLQRSPASIFGLHNRVSEMFTCAKTQSGHSKSLIITAVQVDIRPLQLGSNISSSSSLPHSHKSAHHFIRLPPNSPSNSLLALFYYIISCLWARSNISGTARSAEAQYYSLACDQLSNGFARHCWAPNNRMWSANWQTGQTPSGAAPRAASSGWLSSERRRYGKWGGYGALQNASHHHHHHINKNIFWYNMSAFSSVHNHSAGQQCLLAGRASYQGSCMCPNHKN